eukprot:5837572-Amphidinium_carterae.1
MCIRDRLFTEVVVALWVVEPAWLQELVVGATCPTRIASKIAPSTTNKHRGRQKGLTFWISVPHVRMFVVPAEVWKYQVVLTGPLDDSQSDCMSMFDTHHMLATIKTAEVDGHILLAIPELIGATAV